MSIEYFVEGKIKTSIKGDYSVFSKENITHNTAVSVEQQGNEEGVKYKDAKKINTNDNPSNLIEVSLNLFFDGTQNNKTNTELGKDYEESNHQDDSYTNDYSNVARAFDALNPEAENQVAEYIEGIGTEDKKSDTVLPGVGLGTGDTGVEAKVAKGCAKGAEALKNYAGKNIHLKINVFGFSRGATAARHFVHIATNPGEIVNTSGGKGMAVSPHPAGGKYIEVDQNDELVSKYGYFGACLRINKVIPQKVTINFVGLYDTVASFGVVHRPQKILEATLFPGDTKQLGLKSISKAEFVLQIAADDEFRDNFDLTNIESTGVKGLEFTIPGVHSDIGGCYVNGMPETVDLYKEYGIKNGCEEYRRILINEGWYRPEEISINYIPPTTHEGVESYMLVGHRKSLFNSYDKVSLSTMLHYSSEFGVEYLKDLVESDHAIKEMFLNKIFNQLLLYFTKCGELRNRYISEYNETGNSGDYMAKLRKIDYQNFIINPDDLKILRNKYLHWSASVTKFGLGPKVGNVANGKKRKRNIQDG